MSDVNDMDINKINNQEEKEEVKKENNQVPPAEEKKEEAIKNEEVPKENAPKEEAPKEEVKSEESQPFQNINEIVEEPEKEPEKEPAKESEPKKKTSAELEAELEAVKEEEKRLKAEAKLEKEKRKLDQRKEKERKAAEKRAKEEADKRAGIKKPKFFDKGILPALAGALGTLIGATIGYTLVVAPFAIGTLIAATVKGAVYVSKSIAYNRESKENEKKLGEKKTEEKEKEDSKKSEKELEKSKSIEKEKVKAPEPKEKELQNKDKAKKNIGKNQLQYTQEEKDGFTEWYDKERNSELNFINQKHRNQQLEQKLGQFKKHIIKLTCLAQLHQGVKDGNVPLNNDEYQQQYSDTNSMNNYSSQPEIKSMVDSIKTEGDMNKFRTLANENNGKGLIEELSKHSKKIESAEKNVQKLDKNKALENQIQQPQQPQVMAQK